MGPATRHESRYSGWGVAALVVWCYHPRMPTPQPGVYRKGHETRVADTATEAVNLAFDGFQLQTAQAVESELSRPELQAQAKALGIPANQTNAALAEAIASHVPSSDEVAGSNERPTPDHSYVSGLGDGVDEVDDDRADSESL